MHYFDHNATTPLHPAAREAWLQAMDAHWLNPSSPYRAAAEVRVRWEALRARFAALLEIAPERLIFNSGATEGNNAVIRHLRATLPLTARIGVSRIEHPSVLACARECFGDRIDWLPVDADGQLCPEAVDLCRLSAVVLMAANNETGMHQPWHRLASACAEAGVPFHCDASQWIGKEPSEGLATCGYVSGCAHKFGGPRGVGFLVVPAGVDLAGSLLGGHQQSGRRAGTEDFAGVAAMLAALEAVTAQPPVCGAAGKRALWDRLAQELPGVRVIGRLDGVLWNTLALILPEFTSQRWIRALERRGFLLGAGSACSTGREGPSHVLAAMGIESAAAGRSLRISSGWTTTQAHWEALAAAILESYEELRAGGASSSGRVIEI